MCKKSSRPLLSLKIATLALLGLFNFSCVSQEISSYESKVEDFLRILIEKNENILVEKYAGGSSQFTSGGKLNKDIYDFLYEPRSEDSETRSINQILETTALSFKIIPQSDEVITVLFFKESDAGNISNLSFLQNQWMKKYIACEFEVVGGELFFYQNICFAETDGPYPPAYGI